MSHATRAALLMSLLFVLLLLAVGINFFMVRYQIGHSQSEWCSTLKLLTSHPVPKPTDPSGNPSRMAAYLLYEDFVYLAHQFGCAK